MNRPWFKRFGWFYLPTSAPGFVATLAAIAFCIQVFLAVDRRSQSVSDTLYGVFPFFVCSFLLWDWVASKTNARSEEQDSDIR